MEKIYAILERGGRSVLATFEDRTFVHQFEGSKDAALKEMNARVEQVERALSINDITPDVTEDRERIDAYLRSVEVAPDAFWAKNVSRAVLISWTPVHYRQRRTITLYAEEWQALTEVAASVRALSARGVYAGKPSWAALVRGIANGEFIVSRKQL